MKSSDPITMIESNPNILENNIGLKQIDLETFTQGRHLQSGFQIVLMKSEEERGSEILLQLFPVKKTSTLCSLLVS